MFGTRSFEGLFLTLCRKVSEHIPVFFVEKSSDLAMSGFFLSKKSSDIAMSGFFLSCGLEVVCLEEVF